MPDFDQLFDLQDAPPVLAPAPPTVEEPSFAAPPGPASDDGGNPVLRMWTDFRNELLGPDDGPDPRYPPLKDGHCPPGYDQKVKGGDPKTPDCVPNQNRFVEPQSDTLEPVETPLETFCETMRHISETTHRPTPPQCGPTELHTPHAPPTDEPLERVERMWELERVIE